ncbi:MAG: ATP synthase F1 subunit epsilon [Candidatus Moranbacteria bacterium]|nr:ATP synthase F1 subunit epsilon [Candidatus Moranbacteria bacterium]OIQ03725.1 MAG: ATP synthase F1 subunit epsilon [Candidatus Moranbacteria bacterium CG2_30_41_165]PIP25577.1 MAG: ATP synthase F1 subunit epsilon [Candidatus Moranbacteria bacterium CG23_combo_of_CG06-09_8_20_14_all_41_28]PIV85920.1 MAG: ATP synthase F1 subunit epsilon [Candidatus Moranbacteria bacterium CG17_big_fil_post_rev_8_21_14_2_50_41_107]PIW94562.1 MAG: ATP synthase F1 subunit epsilon [Candidatus Moranbacteria bacter
MALIKFKIVTPEKIVIEEEVYQITLPVLGGAVTILPHHIPYIGALSAGEIIFRKEPNGREMSLATSGGFVEFHNNTLLLLADTAERAEDIDVTRAEEARKRAEALKQERLTMDDEEYARTAAMIEKEMIRVRVARKHHSKRNISLDN